MTMAQAKLSRTRAARTRATLMTAWLAAAATVPGATGAEPEPLEGTLHVDYLYDSVELDFVFPFAALPEGVQERVLDGEGAYALPQFAHQAASFDFPTWARCHIEDQRTAPNPALIGVDAGSDPAEREARRRALAGERVQVNYEYHCDGILSDRLLDSLDVMLFVSMPSLQAVELRGAATEPGRLTQPRHRIRMKSG
jgi:hypothetical protein